MMKINGSDAAPSLMGALVILMMLVCFPGCSSRDVTLVKISLESKSAFPVTDYQEIIVGNFFFNDVDDFDSNEEFRRFLKKECRQKTKFTVIDETPPPLPSLTPEELYDNAGYWKKMGEDYEAPLILTGSIFFELTPRTAFEMRKVTTYDGQTLYRNVPEEYTDFKLTMNLVCIDGKTGDVLHEEALDNKNTVLRGRMEDLDGFHAGLKKLSPRIIRLLKPRSRTATRAILSS
jgi:hypothetical protein